MQHARSQVVIMYCGYVNVIIEERCRCRGIGYIELCKVLAMSCGSKVISQQNKIQIACRGGFH